VLKVDDQDGDIAQAGPPRSQIAETLVAGSVDDEQAGHVDVHFVEALALADFRDELVLREEGGTDLLGDTACLALLHVGVPDLVEQGGLAGVHVAQDTADGTAELSGFACEVGMVVLEQFGLLLLLLVLDHLLDLLFGGLLALLLLLRLFFGCLIQLVQLLPLPLQFFLVFLLDVDAQLLESLDLGLGLLGLPEFLLLFLAFALFLLFLQSLLLPLELEPETLLLLLEFILLLLLLLRQQRCRVHLGSFLSLILVLSLAFLFLRLGLLLLRFLPLRQFALLLQFELGRLLLFFLLLLEFFLLALGEPLGGGVVVALLVGVRLDDLLLLLTHRMLI